MLNRFKIPFEVGTYAGLVAFAIFLIFWFAGLSPLGPARVTVMWLPIVFIFIAVHKQRKTTGSEGFSFRDAFFSGMVTVVALGFVKGILVFMMAEFIDIAMVDKMYDDWIRVFEFLQNLPGADKETIAKQIDTFTNSREYPASYEIGFSELNANFYGGFVVSLLAALIYNRKPKNVAKA